jgi:hypothetical protein
MSDTKSIKSIQAWNTRAQTLLKDGKTLAETSKVAETLAAAQKMGKVAGALNIAGVGLDIVLSFLATGPTAAQLILQAIQDLSNKVTDLWVALDAKFDQAMFGTDWDVARAQFLPMQTQLDKMRTDIMKMQEYAAAKDKDSYNSIADQFYKDFDQAKIIGLLHSLSNFSSGKEFHLSIYSTCYNFSNGQLQMVASIGVYLVNNFAMALSALALWRQIDWEKRHPDEKFPDERRDQYLKEINHDHNDALQTLIAEFDVWTKKCETELEINIGKYLDIYCASNSGSATSKATASQTAVAIASVLKARYTWVFFGVLVYATSGSVDATGANYIDRPSQAFKGDAKASLFIHFRSHEDKHIAGVPISTNPMAYTNPKQISAFDFLPMSFANVGVKTQMKTLGPMIKTDYPGSALALLHGTKVFGVAYDSTPYSADMIKTIGIKETIVTRLPHYEVEPLSFPHIPSFGDPIVGPTSDLVYPYQMHFFDPMYLTGKLP